MISAVCWVKRGAQKADPERHAFDSKVMEALVQQHEQLRIHTKDDDAGDGDDEEDEGDVPDAEAEDDATESKAMTLGDDDQDAAILKELGMDKYDEEEDPGPELFLGGKKLAVFENNEEDPYVTVPDDQDESDEEDLALTSNDAVLVVGKTEDEHSSIEVHVFTESDSNLYVHHDFALPAIPLCLSWMDFDPRNPEEKGSYVAVGTMNPGIEIWDLDVMDNVEPVAVLGGRNEPNMAEVAVWKQKARKDKKAKKKLKEVLLGTLKEGSHADAVMCTAWHPAHRNRLASGSADGTIKLWNLATQSCEATLTHHKSKVQSLEWNPAEPSILLSGSFDRTIAVVDVRNPSNPKFAQVDADIECVRWCPTQPFMFLASTEAGTVTCHDARDLSKPRFTLKAHDKACSALSWNPVCEPVMFATGSVDKHVKLWAIVEGKPTLLCSKDPQVGAIFSLSFDMKDGSPFILAAGGSQGKICVWDTMENEAIDRHYGKLGFGDRNTKR